MKKLLGILFCFGITCLLGLGVSNNNSNLAEDNSNSIYLDNTNLSYFENETFIDLNENQDENFANISFKSKLNLYEYEGYDLVSDEVPEILTMNFSAQCRIDNGAIVYEVTMQDKDGIEHTDIVNGYVFDNGDVMLLTDEMEPIYLSQDNVSNVEQCGWFTNLLKSAFVKVVTTVAKIKYAIYKTVSDAVIAIGKRVLISLANSGNIAIVDHVQAITNYSHNKNLSFPSSSYATYSGYIINQNYFENWKIGVQNIKHSGCGIIAIYNALRSFGKISSDGSPQKFASLISEVESESGLLLLGQFGVTPAGIERGLLFNGIGTMSYTNQNLFLKRVDAAPTGKTFIFLVLNNQNDITDGLHYYAVRKVGYNEYNTYNFNGYHKSKCGVDKLVDEKSLVITGYECY